jgi:hypothetical protein
MGDTATLIDTVSSYRGSTHPGWAVLDHKEILSPNWDREKFMSTNKQTVVTDMNILSFWHTVSFLPSKFHLPSHFNPTTSYLRDSKKEEKRSEDGQVGTER